MLFCSSQRVATVKHRREVLVTYVYTVYLPSNISLAGNGGQVHNLLNLPLLLAKCQEQA